MMMVIVALSVDDGDDDADTGKLIFFIFAVNLFPMSNAVTYILANFA